MIELVGRVGRWALNQLAAGARVSVLMVDTMTWLVIAPIRGRGFRLRSAVEHFVEFGVRSLPIVGMICFLVGVIIALQSSYTLDKWGANRFIATLVAVSALREMAPLMTAVLMTGRSGSAITAEIGTMKVGEEIDALDVMGLNPIKYLVAPKFAAMVLAVPCVTVLGMFIMIFGGYTASVFVVGVDSWIYIDMTIQAVAEKDLVMGLTKSLFFAIAISGSASTVDCRLRAGPRGWGGRPPRRW